MSMRVGHAKWPWLLSLAFVMLPAAFPFVSAKKTVVLRRPKQEMSAFFYPIVKI